MPRLFDTRDLERATPQTETRAARPYTVKDAGTWEMTFDKEATEDIDRLKAMMPRARSREDVVYTALEILALSVYRDVTIRGKFDGVPQEVVGLWD